MTTKILAIATAAGLLIGSTAIVQAQMGDSRNGGVSDGPGASASSPGHEMQEHGSQGGPAASGFAPGRRGDRDDTVGRGDRDDRMGDRDRDDRMGDRDRDDRMGRGGDRDDRTNGFGGRDRDTDGRTMDDDRRGVDKE